MEFPFTGELQLRETACSTASIKNQAFHLRYNRAHALHKTIWAFTLCQ